MQAWTKAVVGLRYAGTEIRLWLRPFVKPWYTATKYVTEQRNKVCRPGLRLWLVCDMRERKYDFGLGPLYQLGATIYGTEQRNTVCRNMQA